MDMTRRGFIGLFAKVTAAAAAGNIITATANAISNSTQFKIGLDVISLSCIQEEMVCVDTSSLSTRARDYMAGGLCVESKIELVAYFNGGYECGQLTSCDHLKDFYIPTPFIGKMKGIHGDFIVQQWNVYYDLGLAPKIEATLIPSGEIWIEPA